MPPHFAHPVRPSAPPAAAGFTLIEILVVIVIAGILLAIALPRMQTVRTSARLNAAAQQLGADLRRAQVEGIKRNRTVTVTKTNDSTYTVEYIGTRILPERVKFTAGPNTVTFATFGPPTTGAASYSVSLDSRAKTVALTAAGLVTIQ